MTDAADTMTLETTKGPVVIKLRPDLAPNHVARIKQLVSEGFSAKLWSIDLTGYNERLVKTPTDGSDPSWSSLLSE